jgi:hypothetical protein
MIVNLVNANRYVAYHAQFVRIGASARTTLNVNPANARVNAVILVKQVKCARNIINVYVNTICSVIQRYVNHDVVIAKIININAIVDSINIALEINANKRVVSHVWVLIIFAIVLIIRIARMVSALNRVVKNVRTIIIFATVKIMICVLEVNACHRVVKNVRSPIIFATVKIMIYV